MHAAEDDDNTAAYDVRGLDVTAGDTSGATVQWVITIDVDEHAEQWSYVRA